MSLSFDITATAVPLPMSDEDAALNTAIVFTLMAADMNGFESDEDVNEFMVRCYLLKMVGMFPASRMPTLVELDRFKGIRTNVATKTRTAFVNSLRHEMVRRAERQALEQRDAEAVPA